jgi:hypothetical protein
VPLCSTLGFFSPHGFSQKRDSSIRNFRAGRGLAERA